MSKIRCGGPNHWHMVLRPREDGELSEFMRWLTVTHTQRWHAGRGTAGTGHIYQGRFKSFPVQRRGPSAAQRAMGLVETAEPLWALLRYVERNALRAGLAERAEDWRWSSLRRRVQGKAQEDVPLCDPPGGWPQEWLEVVNQPQTEEELAAIRRCVFRGRPFVREAWVKRIAARLDLASTLRPRGRPRKTRIKGS